MSRADFVKKYFDNDTETTVQSPMKTGESPMNPPPLLRPSYPELQAVINRPRYSPGARDVKLAQHLRDWDLQGVTANVDVSVFDRQIISTDMNVVKLRLLDRMEKAIGQFEKQMDLLRDQTAQKLGDWSSLAENLDKLHREGLERIAILEEDKMKLIQALRARDSIVATFPRGDAELTGSLGKRQAPGDSSSGFVPAKKKVGRPRKNPLV